MATGERPPADGTGCALCDLPVEDGRVENDAGEVFCCVGCRNVHDVLGDRADRDEAVVAGDATGDGATPATDDSEGDIPSDADRAVFAVDGMHCTTCEQFLQAVATDVDGVSDAAASYPSELLRVTYDPDRVDEREIQECVSGLGYRVGDPDADDGPGLADALAADRLRTVLAVLAIMPVMALYVLFVYPTYVGIYPTSFLYSSTVTTMVFVPLTVWSTLVVAGIGYPFVRGAYVSLRVGQPNMDLLVSLAVLAAYAYSVVSFVVLGGRTVYFDVAVLILGVVTVGTHVERRLTRATLDVRADLADDRPTEARRRLADGSTETVPVDAVQPGDELVVEPGERVPLDGTVREGAAAVDESLTTGEAVPDAKAPGAAVVGGSVVLDGRLVVAVGADATSTLDRLLALSRAAQSGTSGIQRHVDRFAVAFVPLVLALAVATAVGWALLGAPAEQAVLTGVAVLVISCPCSLGIATPLALAAGSKRALEAGTLLVDTSVLERAPDSEVVVFDKTGTLTTAEMTVTAVETAGTVDADAVLDRAAAVERSATHPIADAIAAAVSDDPPTSEDFEQGPRAVRATVAGSRVTVGHVDTFGPESWTVPEDLAAAAEAAYEAGEIPTLVGWDGRVRGVVRVRDRPRSGWESAVSDLAAEARRLVVLTGDDERMARPFADHPAIDEVFASVKPAAKETTIRRLRAEGTTTMVGDGTNDAAALAAADLGVALESGTAVTADAADAVVTTDDLAGVPALFDVAVATRRRIRQNLGWALAYNAVAIPLAVVGLVNPLVAAVLMGASSIVVVLNSRRSLG